MLPKFSSLSFLSPFLGSVLGVILCGGLCFSVFNKVYVNSPVQYIPKANFKSLDKLEESNLIPVTDTPFGDLKKVKELPRPKLKAPTVPAMPELQESLSVVGLIPPEMAMLKRNGKVGTVKAYTDTVEFGKIGSITQEGVYVDGKFHKYEIFKKNLQK